MNIALLLIAITLLDVGMLCYSLYLDKEIAKLKGINAIYGHAYPVARMGRFERFVHSPLGTLMLAVCFFGMLFTLREAEKHEGRGNAVHGGTVQTVQEGQLTILPCADIAEARSGQLARR